MSTHAAIAGMRGRALQASRARTKWFSRPVVIGLCVLPLGIAALAPQDAWGAALLAYVNALIIGVSAVRLLKQGTLQGLIPVLFLLWMGLGWVLGTMYFAMFVPEMTYKTMNDERLVLAGNAKLQLCVLVFLVLYLSIFGLLASRRVRFTEYPIDGRRATRLSLAAAALFVPGLTLNALGKLQLLPEPLEYVANGANLYLAALPLVIGAMFGHIGFALRFLTLTFLGAVAAFNILGNARGDAAMPIAMFTLGYMFISGVTPRRKFISMIVGAFVFLVIVVVGDTTRAVLRNIGFGDLSARVEALGQWQEVAARTSPFTKTFGRLFWTAGHTILTMMPESYSYLDFEPDVYFTELLMRQLPGKLVHTPAYYSSTERLRAYDFNITDKSSVELSFLGSMWMLGGWVPLILGSIAIALIHVLLSHLLAALASRSCYAAVFVFAMIALALLWGQNLDLISQTRWLTWRVGIATVLYVLFVGPLLSGPARPAPPGPAVARRPA